MGQGLTSVGSELEERYFLQKIKLGQGSFGSVYRAVDRQKNRTVAIKQLDKESLPKRGVTRHDIEREIKMMQACPHENITELYDTFEDDKSIYLALEYCDGGDFGDKVKERGMGITELEVSDWMQQMCAAILAMHVKGICHRDIKPDNFMVQDTSKLKLSDFGLAIYVPKGKLLQEKCGTPAFMSPEQHRLPKWSVGYSYPADMWAVGVSMYMMMFGGKHPFLNERGGLDDALLLNGELDFRDKSAGFGFFNFAALGGAPLRFSEEARSVCKRMVEPDPHRRMSAEESAHLPWLQSARAAGAQVAPLGRTPSNGGSGSGSRAATPPPQESPPGRAPQDIEPQAFAARGAAAVPAIAVRGPDAAPVVASDGGGSDPSRTPGPDGRRVWEQAAELEAKNQALLTELEERKRREEELLAEKKHMEMKQKIMERQRTKEMEELERKRTQHDMEVKKVKEELERLRERAGRDASDGARLRPPQMPDKSPHGDMATGLDRVAAAQSAARGVLLRKGAKCQYESATYGWVPAVVKCYNEFDGTFTLDVKQNAPPDKICPPSDISTSEAWPPDTMVSYLSNSMDCWLPAVVISYNESDGTYNLNVREHAKNERIRLRGEPTHGRPDPSRFRQATQNLQTAMPGGSQDDGLGRVEGQRSGARQGPPETKADADRVAPVNGVPASTPPRWVNKGDYCCIQEHGLVKIDSPVGRDGCYTVRTRDQKQFSVKIEDMHAPEESRYAWPAGTQVSYLSASVGKWIDAQVIAFNNTTNTYNLNVRKDAAPDKVRPR